MAAIAAVIAISADSKFILIIRIHKDMQLLRPDVYVWLHIDDTYGHTQAAHAHKLRTSHVQLTQYKPHVDHCKNR